MLRLPERDLTRIEIRSLGGLPNGVTAESLSGEHKSVLRNPLIAESFPRTGAVEIRDRGTNRVIEECDRNGIEPPDFQAAHAEDTAVAPRRSAPPGAACR